LPRRHRVELVKATSSSAAPCRLRVAALLVDENSLNVVAVGSSVVTTEQRSADGSIGVRAKALPDHHRSRRLLRRRVVNPDIGLLKAGLSRRTACGADDRVSTELMRPAAVERMKVSFSTSPGRDRGSPIPAFRTARSIHPGFHLSTAGSGSCPNKWRRPSARRYESRAIPAAALPASHR